MVFLAELPLGSNAHCLIRYNSHRPDDDLSLAKVGSSLYNDSVRLVPVVDVEAALHGFLYHHIPAGVTVLFHVYTEVQLHSLLYYVT